VAAAEPGGHEVIGILSPLVVGTYMSEVIEGVAGAAAAVGARVVAIQTLDLSTDGPEPPVSGAEARPTGGRDYVGYPVGTEALAPHYTLRAAWDLVSGFVVVLKAVEPWYLRAIRDAGKPLVIVSDEPEGCDWPVVLTDNRTGIIEAVSHLVGHGHRRIAFAGSLKQLDIRERREAYREALAMNGIEPDDDLFFDTTDNLEGGGEIAARRMLAAGMPSTAVVAGTDYNALGMMKVLREAGEILPRDQAIVGFDDVAAAAEVQPALSTVHQSARDTARIAANLLLDMLRGREVARGRHLVPATFVPRASCGCVGFDGPANADAFVGLSPRDRLRRRLQRRLLGPDGPTVAESTALDRVVELVADYVERGAVEGGADALAELSQTLHTLNPRSVTVTASMDCLRQYRRDLGQSQDAQQTLDRVERVVSQVGSDLTWFVQDDEERARSELHRSMSLEHQLSMTLLSDGAGDPRSLGWLSRTTARAGCLGLWPAEIGAAGGAGSGLTIAGSYSLEGDPPALPAQVRIEEFPPASLLQDEGWQVGEIAVVLPVKTRSMDLGLLAVVNPVDATQITGHDRLFEQAALLSVAIERTVMTERLRRSNADLATFSHAMAHDLRNPLATITMWASVARSQAASGGDPAAILQMIDQIGEVARFSTDLVGDLLRYAELDRGEEAAELVDLNRALRLALATTRSALADQAAVVDAADLPTVPGRFGQLELVLQNLIENGVKYRGVRPPRLHIDATLEGGIWTLRCRDNGEGVPPMVRDRIFEPFVRGHLSVPGSGLGLATCRRIVEGHGGRIWIESSGAAGTTFAFTLPASPTSKGTAGPSPRLTAGIHPLGGGNPWDPERPAAPGGPGDRAGRGRPGPTRPLPSPAEPGRPTRGRG